MTPGAGHGGARPADAPVEIAAYDAGWPSRFEAERELLDDVLSRWLVAPIEHVGSTAVPNMPAKPIIDMMAPVRTLQESRPAIDVLTEAGYVHAPYKPELMHWFCKPSPEMRTHHLYLVPHESETWSERLAFRDALRVNPEWAVEYARLKRQLADSHRYDREAYTDAKEPFIRSILWRISELWNGGPQLHAGRDT